MARRGHFEPSTDGGKADATRSCIGCRTTASRQELLRLVALPGQSGEPGHVGIDWAQRAPGRGAHICPQRRCVAKAAKKGAFARALGAGLKSSVDDFVADMVAGLQTRFRQRLSLARRAGAVAAGQNPAADSMKTNKALVIVLASDVSASGARKYASNAERKGLAVLQCMTGGEIGKGIGMDFCAVASVEAQPFAAELETLGKQILAARGQ